MSSSKRPRWLHWLLFIAWCSVLTLVMYGAALRLPFFFDDFVHYPFVEANNVAQIWRSTDELAYYRPLNFSIWRVTYELMQRHDPLLDHAINLVLHAINGMLVGWLAARLWAGKSNQFPVVTREGESVDWWRAYLSASLFLLFPFSYQAVPWVGSLSHLLVTTLILLSLATYVQMRRTGQRIWGIVSLFCAFLAPFAHENGVLVAPFLFLIELTTPGATGRLRRAIGTGLVYTLPLLAWFFIWRSLPRLEGGGLFPNNLEGLLQNTAYFVQGIAYPFTWAGGWLRDTRGVNDMTAVALLSVLALTTAVFIQVRCQATRRSVLPWLWAGLAILPAIFSLVFDYVINGPRLLMVASVGAAWLWADVALLFARCGRASRRESAVRGAIALGLMALLLVQNALFIGERMTLHRILGDGFKQIIAETVRANEAGQEAVVVNFPSWLAPRQATYALGHEGVLFWPDYVPPALFMAVHTGTFGDLNFVRADAIRPDLNAFYYGLTGPAPDWPSLSAVPSQVFVTQYEPEGVMLVPAGELDVKLPPNPEPVAVFVDGRGETAVTLVDGRVQPGENGVRLDLTWLASRPLDDVTVFIHLLDANGQLVAQADGDPLGGSYPFALWTADSAVRDTRWIVVDDPAAVQVRVGLYNRLTGERLSAYTPAGEGFADGAVPLERFVGGE